MSYSEDDILKEARERLSRGLSASEDIRDHFIANLKFISGDQWTGEAKAARIGRLPMLVINRLRTFASILINEQRQNQLAAKISPRGNGANDDTADILSGMVRDIESESESEIAYDTAFKYTIEGNHGWWCTRKEYESPESFNYVIRDEPIEDPLCVVCDPSARKADRSDMLWLFKYHDIPKDEFKARYPRAKATDFSDDTVLRAGAEDWIKDKTVRVAEYWRIVFKSKTLIQYLDVKSKQWRRGFVQDLAKKGITIPLELISESREVDDCRYVENFLLNGMEVIYGLGKTQTGHWEYEWDGQWIPFVPVIGDERWIDGKRKIFSAISHSHDAQRMTNYYATQEAIAAGLAPRPTWIGAVGQFKTDPNWSDANKSVAKREYDAIGVDGKPLPPPHYETFEPPTQAFLLGKQASIDDIKATMGMSDALTGMKETDQSGKAIEALKQQGNTANFNFFDNLIRSIRHGTRIKVDLIPHVYDTEREVRILGQDKTEKIVKVNAQLMSKDGVPEVDEKGLPKGYFLSIGDYGVAIEVGPSDQTQKEADQRDITEMLTVAAKGYPQALPKLMYLYARAHPSPMWQKMADAIKPPDMGDEDSQIPPELQQAMAQMQQTMQQQQELLVAAEKELKEKNEQKQMELASKERMNEENNAVKLTIADISAQQKMTSDAIGAMMQRLELLLSDQENALQRQHETDEGIRQRQHEASESQQDRDAAAMQSQQQDQLARDQMEQQAQQPQA